MRPRAEPMTSGQGATRQLGLWGWDSSGWEDPAACTSFCTGPLVYYNTICVCSSPGLYWPGHHVRRKRNFFPFLPYLKLQNSSKRGVWKQQNLYSGPPPPPFTHFFFLHPQRMKKYWLNFCPCYFLSTYKKNLIPHREVPWSDCRDLHPF